MQVSVLHDFSRHCFMCVMNCKNVEDHREGSDVRRQTQSDIKYFTSETSAGHRFIPAVANDMSIKVSLSQTSAVLSHTNSEPSPSLLRAWWSRSAGWTGLGSSWETEQSFRCRFGWLTRRAACSPAPHNAWGINSSTSSSARSGPFNTQTK